MRNSGDNEVMIRPKPIFGIDSLLHATSLKIDIIPVSVYIPSLAVPEAQSAEDCQEKKLRNFGTCVHVRNLGSPLLHHARLAQCYVMHNSMHTMRTRSADV